MHIIYKIKEFLKQKPLQQNYLVNISNVNETEYGDYFPYAITINRIKECIREKTGQQMELMTEELSHYFSCYQTTRHDIQRNRARIIGSILDVLGNVRPMRPFFKDGYPLEYVEGVEPFNNVVYYEEFNVAIANCTIYKADREMNFSYVLAPSEIEYRKYEAYIVDYWKVMDQGKLTIFMDTKNGLHRSTKEITSLVNRDDVLLDEDLKLQIFQSLDQFFEEGGSFFKKYEIPYKRGILLWGAPGNGKTTLIKSVLGSIKAPIVYWQVSEYTNSESIVEIFNYFDDKPASVLIIEDMDSIPTHVRSTFLNCLDGVETREGLFIIGTTNYPEKVDKALLNRAGRFDRSYAVERPNAAIRRQYLVKKKTDKLVTEEDFDYLIKNTEDFSMSILNEIHISVALQHHYDGVINVQKIINELKDINKKQKTGDFGANKKNTMGFTVNDNDGLAKEAVPSEGRNG